MEIGVYTFADLGTHPTTKETISPRQRMINLLEEIELADQLGLMYLQSANIIVPITWFHHRLLYLEQPL